MRTLELGVGASAYELRLEGDVLGRLPGGAATLLAGAGERLRESDIEAAIERAEDWLMPIVRQLQGLWLRVQDDTGRVRRALGAQRSWDTAQVEQAFGRVHDAVAHGRASHRQDVADIVLLRELAHHGALAGILLEER